MRVPSLGLALSRLWGPKNGYEVTNQVGPEEKCNQQRLQTVTQSAPLVSGWACLTLAPRCGTTLLSEGGMFAADRQALWGAIGVGVLFVVAGGLLGGLPGLVVVAIIVGAVGWAVSR